MRLTTIVGHSLGGAEAVLCAADLATNYGIKSKLYTYGCPRVGNNAFKEGFVSLMGHNSIRMVKDHDIVPHLPLEVMGFQHTSTEIWEHKNDYVVCDGSGEDPACSNSNLFDFSISDHRSYMNLATKCVSSSVRILESEAVLSE